MFSIGTLTHDDIKRDEYLEITINTFLENTNLPEDTIWYIFHNGQSDSPVIEIVKKMTEKWSNKVQFMLFCENKNYGVGVGINKLNEWLKLSKYSLFLEGDWITMPKEFTNQDKDWLIRSLDVMEKENINQIQLRKYLNDIDDRQFGFGYWTNEVNVEKVENGYVYLKEREYTNNPHIRQNQTYFDLNIFPLQEFFDEYGNPTELKTSSQWGQAEIKAEGLGKQLKSVWLQGGIMVHCDHFQYDTWNEVKEKITGCEYNDGSLLHCKYGFPFPRKEFCTHCDNTKPFTDLEKHNWRFEQNLNNES
jgi:hypothetical protein